MEVCNIVEVLFSVTKPAIEDPNLISNFIKSLKVRNKTDKTDVVATFRYAAERKPKAFVEMPCQSVFTRINSSAYSLK